MRQKETVTDFPQELMHFLIVFFSNFPGTSDVVLKRVTITVVKKNSERINGKERTSTTTATRSHRKKRTGGRGHMTSRNTI